MPLRLFTVMFLLLVVGVGLKPAPVQAQSEAPIPLGAEWQSTLAHVEQLPALERVADESLKGAATIRSGPEILLYATWRTRTVTFRIDRDFGLYALGIELVPEAVQHAIETDDAELSDLEYRAPMRLAVVNKYGQPRGLASQWDGLDIRSLPDAAWQDSSVTDWSYALSWLIWEGRDTRIAVGEQEVWYVSQAWLEQHRQARTFLEQHPTAVQGIDLVRQAARQQRLDHTRNAVPTRAAELEPLL